MEEWKLFKELPRVILYVSSEGKVKSVKKKDNSEKILSLYKRSIRYGNYLSFGYTEKGKKIVMDIHLAICEAFKGPKPGDNYHADHINDNPVDNRASNLQWLIKEDNCSKGWHKAKGKEWRSMVDNLPF